MLRLLFFMNAMGSIFFLIHSLLLPFEKNYMPPKCRVFLCRVNLMLFLIPFPALLFYLRRYFDSVTEMPLDPSLYNGSHITVHLPQDLSFILPKPDVIQISAILLWVAILVMVSIRFLARQRRLHKIERALDLYQKEDLANSPVDVAALVRTAREELHMKKDPGIYLIKGLPAPHVRGIFHPALYMPSPWNVPEQVYYMAIKHELAHIQHRDLLFQRLSLIACIISWYNPIVYILSDRMASYNEMAADACACDGAPIADQKSYRITIVNLSGITACSPFLSFSGLGLRKKWNNKYLKERILMMEKNKIFKHKAIKMAATALMSAVMFTLSAIPALAYSLPATVESEDLSIDKINTFSLGTLSPEDDADPLSVGVQQSGGTFSSLIEDLDFSESDWYCVDENGIQSDSTLDPQIACNHRYTKAEFTYHELHSNGSCTIYVHNADRCAKCGHTVVKDLVGYTTFVKCPH